MSIQELSMIQIDSVCGGMRFDDLPPSKNVRDLGRPSIWWRLWHDLVVGYDIG